MSSAAVIGRQLRQQQSSSRTSGPVVPPTQYKGRTPIVQSSSVQSWRTPQDRDLNSLGTQSTIGVDADKKFAHFSQLYVSNEFYPHPAHRQKTERAERKAKKKKEPRLRCTWHCFIVSMKALLPGIIMLVAGTVMSVVGFFADSLSSHRVQLENGTALENVDTEMKTNLHNLTYVGPVIMGLGGIVIVAACVLTFEVRDTLGVKDNPKENDSPQDTIVVDKDLNRKRTKKTEVDDNLNKSKNHNLNQKTNTNDNGNVNGKRNEVNRTNNVKNVKNADNDSNSKVNSTNTNHGKQHNSQQNTQHIDRQVEQMAANHSRQQTDTTRIDTNNSHNVNNGIHNRTIIMKPDILISNVNRQYTIDMSLVRSPSPQETELSDPEGCSLSSIPIHNWRTRCSCSGSPTNSMLLALHKLENEQQQQRTSPLRTYGSYNHINGTIPFRSQMPPRHSKILASVESDGLSSSTSSEWELDIRMLQTTQQQQQQPKRATNNELHPSNVYSIHVPELNQSTSSMQHGPPMKSTTVQSNRRTSRTIDVDQFNAYKTGCYPLLRVEHLSTRPDCANH